MGVGVGVGVEVVIIVVIPEHECGQSKQDRTCDPPLLCLDGFQWVGTWGVCDSEALV